MGILSLLLNLFTLFLTKSTCVYKEKYHAPCIQYFSSHVMKCSLGYRVTCQIWIHWCHFFLSLSVAVLHHSNCKCFREHNNCYTCILRVSKESIRIIMPHVSWLRLSKRLIVLLDVWKVNWLLLYILGKPSYGDSERCWSDDNPTWV